MKNLAYLWAVAALFAPTVIVRLWMELWGFSIEEVSGEPLSAIATISLIIGVVFAIITAAEIRERLD